MGTEGPQWGPVELIYLSLCIYVHGVVRITFGWSLSWPVELKSNEVIIFKKIFLINERKINFSKYIKLYRNFCLKNGFKLAIKVHLRGPQLHTVHAAAGHGFKSSEWQYSTPVRRLSKGLLWFNVCLSGCPQEFWTRINVSRRWTPTMEINTNTVETSENGPPQKNAPPPFFSV